MNSTIPSLSDRGRQRHGGSRIKIGDQQGDWIEVRAPTYPNVILVPLTDDPALPIPGLAETIDPTPENACTKRCFALAPFVSCTASVSVRATGSKVTQEQLARIRRQVAEAIGLR